MTKPRGRGIGASADALVRSNPQQAYELSGPLDPTRFYPRFEPRQSGAIIRWRYTFFARPARGWIVWLVVTLWWARYMRHVLPPIAREIDHLAAR